MCGLVACQKTLIHIFRFTVNFDRLAVTNGVFVSEHILLNGILSTDCYLDKKRDLANISDLHIFTLIK